MKYRQANKSRENAVERSGGIERRDRKNAEHFKNTRQEKWIDRREPGRWPGLLAKQAAEALAASEGGGHTTDFVLEWDDSQRCSRDEMRLVYKKREAKQESGAADEPGRSKQQLDAEFHRKENTVRGVSRQTELNGFDAP